MRLVLYVPEQIPASGAIVRFSYEEEYTDVLKQLRSA